MHKYTMEFRIYGETLDPSEVSTDLGIEPSLMIRAGERRTRTTRFEKSMWAYDGFPSTRRWDSFEEGLISLLEKLLPFKDKIEKYRSNYELILWCGHFQSSFNGGPTLSPRVLNLLSEFGVALFIDNYFGSMKKDEEPESTNTKS